MFTSSDPTPQDSDWRNCSQVMPQLFSSATAHSISDGTFSQLPSIRHWPPAGRLLSGRQVTIGEKGLFHSEQTNIKSPSLTARWTVSARFRRSPGPYLNRDCMLE